MWLWATKDGDNGKGHKVLHATGMVVWPLANMRWLVARGWLVDHQKRNGEEGHLWWRRRTIGSSGEGEEGELRVRELRGKCFRERREK